MDEQQLDEWTILMASGIDPLTAWAATDQNDPPPKKHNWGCLCVIVGVLVGFFIASIVN